MRASEKLPLFNPVYFRAEPGSNRIFFVDHKGDWPESGGLRVFTDAQDASSSEPLLPSDRIVYGFCFHPKYLENGYLFIISNGPSKDANKFDRITRVTIARDGAGKVDEGSELVILEWQSNGHNGGDLAFGPDGYLYCPTGDGTTDSDTLETGQGLNDLLAVMLRLGVDHPTQDAPYSIPPDNPFINTPGARPEIWAYGFRNPWRMDYDHQTNQLWLGQNGQDLWEQVYLIRRGENYGWSVQEGSHPFYQLRPKGNEPIVAPVAEHHHSESPCGEASGASVSAALGARGVAGRVSNLGGCAPGVSAVGIWSGEIRPGGEAPCDRAGISALGLRKPGSGRESASGTGAATAATWRDDQSKFPPGTAGPRASQSMGSAPTTLSAPMDRCQSKRPRISSTVKSRVMASTVPEHASDCTPVVGLYGLVTTHGAAGL